MTTTATPTVCIVGAGSMGILAGFHLSLAGAEITYLVRPHRRDQLIQPQRLYCYDDDSLKTFSNYTILTEPEKLSGHTFDFVVFALDGASMTAPAGDHVVDAVGSAFRNTTTQVIIPTGGASLRDRFLDRTGLAPERVTSGGLGVWAYEVAPAEMPLHPAVSVDLHNKADCAYRHLSRAGFVVDDDAAEVARRFTALYDQCAVSECHQIPAAKMQVMATLYPGTVAWELLGWPAAADIDPADTTWQLATAASNELRSLPIYGPQSRPADTITAAALHAVYVSMEIDARPLDAPAFNAYHHGGKMRRQKLEYFESSLQQGDSAGIEMPALQTLVDLLMR